MAFTEPSPKTPEQKANEAIKDIPKEDVTSRMIRWQIAYEDAKASDTAPAIPLGRRGRQILAKQKALKDRKMRNLFKDPV